MQFENALKCHWDFVHLITEEDIIQCNILSLVDADNVEQKIYLFKNENRYGYEVRVYKASPEDAYIPHKLDFQVKLYEANNEFASFFFDRFFFARRFTSMFKELHPEYSVRPI